ncbi:hypothetical protein Acr_12g0008460 [Actinidia rufa]|uniref:Uncharacterized protein n=1 Tax=Actinidia rufa TaxID=165716 RepID=A0A7J0FHY0_9ERIC|nr:hypothetical protein Acr_12g0008460 [Actinidia rufa]
MLSPTGAPTCNAELPPEFPMWLDHIVPHVTSIGIGSSPLKAKPFSNKPQTLRPTLILLFFSPPNFPEKMSLISKAIVTWCKDDYVPAACMQGDGDDDDGDYDYAPASSMEGDDDDDDDDGSDYAPAA